MKAKLLDLASRLEKAINDIQGNETPCRIKITVSALKGFCSPNSRYEVAKGNVCSTYVRDVLKNSGTTFNSQPNAGAFLTGDDRNFNRDYGFPAPSISAGQAQMGDIISAGSPGTQAGFTSHVGIFLGGGLYVGQSPSDYSSQATGDGAGTTSGIKIRPIDQFKDWPKTNYRDTSKACQ